MKTQYQLRSLISADKKDEFDRAMEEIVVSVLHYKSYTHRTRQIIWDKMRYDLANHQLAPMYLEDSNGNQVNILD